MYSLLCSLGLSADSLIEWASKHIFECYEVRVREKFWTKRELFFVLSSFRRHDWLAGKHSMHFALLPILQPNKSSPKLHPIWSQCRSEHWCRIFFSKRLLKGFFDMTWCDATSRMAGGQSWINDSQLSFLLLWGFFKGAFKVKNSWKNLETWGSIGVDV